MHITQNCKVCAAGIAVLLTLAGTAGAKYSGGTGEPDDPYQIATAADLIVLGETPDDYGKCFILTADIDLDPNLPGRKVFDKAPIAPYTNPATGHLEGTPFTGVLDGHGHTISHLTITGGSCLGLFGKLGPWSTIRDLGLLDVKITGSGYLGGLVGINGGFPVEEGGIVTGCYSTGSVSGARQGVGGLVGYNSAGRIATCFSSSSVSGDLSIGGLAGYNYAHISASYSTGSVNGHQAVGGLVGTNVAMIVAGYSSGSVNGTRRVGGLAGENLGNIVTCYSTGSVRGASDVGGIVGYSSGSLQYVRSCVWDTDSSGLSASAGGVGLTTGEMMAPNMLGLNGFANDPNWVLDAGRDYPRLAWQGTPGAMIAEPNIDWLEGQGTTESPYRIDSADQLILLGRANVLWDRHFVLGADIDLDPALPGRRVFPQAPILVFTGVLDGNDHTISHLTIRGGSRLGLFGELGRWNAGASVSRLRLEAVDIAGTGNFVGALLGYTDSHDIYQASITSCSSSGFVLGASYVGGLAGHSSGRIATSSSTSSVSGTSSVGGLAGSNTGSIATSYSTGSVSGDDRVGGLVGTNQNGDITAGYSTGPVNGAKYTGGLVGANQGTVNACYAAGLVQGLSQTGGLIGSASADPLAPDGTVARSFWDTDASGQPASAGGTGKTTAEMQTATAFLATGWDFVGETANGMEDIWWIEEGKDYPHLWWEAPSE
jgi:hypothetical protein